MLYNGAIGGAGKTFTLFAEIEFGAFLPKNPASGNCK